MIFLHNISMIISHQYDGKMDQKLEQRRLWTGCCEGKLQFKEKQNRRPWDSTAVVRHTSYTWKVSFDSSDALKIFPEAAGLRLAFGSILIHQVWWLQTQNLADACGSFPFLSFKKNPSRKTHVKKTQRITPSQATYNVLARQLLYRTDSAWHCLLVPPGTKMQAFWLSQISRILCKVFHSMENRFSPQDLRNSLMLKRYQELFLNREKIWCFASFISSRNRIGTYCLLSYICFFVTLRTVARQAPLSMEFSRQEYWSGLPFPPPGDLSNPAIEPESLACPALAGKFFTTEPPVNWNLLLIIKMFYAIFRNAHVFISHILVIKLNSFRERKQTFEKQLPYHIIHNLSSS